MRFPTAPTGGFPSREALFLAVFVVCIRMLQ